VAVGLALADTLAGRKRVTTCFFGEGAVAEGEFHEALNLASLWQVPVVFCCENNGYAMGTALARSEAELDLVKKAESYHLPGESVDGMDVLAVRAAAGRACARARRGEGPSFIEFRTYRFRPHSMFDPELYRDKEEVERWKEEHDPLRNFAALLRERGFLSDEDAQRCEREAAEEIADAVSFADQSEWEPISELTRFVYADPRGEVAS